MTTTDSKIRPFDTGSHFDAWTHRNCEGCAKYNPETFDGGCEIDGALGAAYLGDGLVDVAIVRRMGSTPDERRWTWECPEREAR